MSNVHYLSRFLRQHAPSLSVRTLEATYCVWIDCSRLQLDADELGARLRRAGLVFSPGSEFDASGASDHYQRINVACARSVVELAAKRLRMVADDRMEEMSRPFREFAL